MARHVDPDDDSFRRSLLRAAAGGLVALVVTFAITGILTRLGRDDGRGGPAVFLTATPTVVAQPATVEPSPSPEDVASPTELQSPTAVPTPAEVTELPDRTVTVQVLYSGASDAAAVEAAEALRALGYDVVAVNGTQHTVASTTLLYSPGQEDAAEQLRERDERFGLVETNTIFVESVNLHVLVGPDFG